MQLTAVNNNKRGGWLTSGGGLLGCLGSQRRRHPQLQYVTSEETRQSSTSGEHSLRFLTRRRCLRLVSGGGVFCAASRLIASFRRASCV